MWFWRVIDWIGRAQTIRAVFVAGFGLVTAGGAVAYFAGLWTPLPAPSQWLIIFGIVLVVFGLFGVVVRAVQDAVGFGLPRLTLPRKLELKVEPSNHIAMTCYFVLHLDRLRNQSQHPVTIEFALEIERLADGKVRQIPGRPASIQTQFKQLPKIVDLEGRREAQTITDTCVVFGYNKIVHTQIGYAPKWGGGKGYKFQVAITNVDNGLSMKRSVDSISL